MTELIPDPPPKTKEQIAWEEEELRELMWTIGAGLALIVAAVGLLIGLGAILRAL